MCTTYHLCCLLTTTRGILLFYLFFFHGNEMQQAKKDLESKEPWQEVLWSAEKAGFQQSQEAITLIRVDSFYSLERCKIESE